ncbi:MAG: hypothetical protein QX198_16645 [Methylococcaceae bacterium]
MRKQQVQKSRYSFKNTGNDHHKNIGTYSIESPLYLIMLILSGNKPIIAGIVSNIELLLMV